MTADGQLSASALRVLGALRTLRATDARSAATDKRIADVARIQVRDVIDAAGELLDAGYLVLASSGTPPGRWLTADAREARRYANSLGRRAVRIWRRRKAVRSAIERTSLASAVGADGQGSLFPETRRSVP